MNEFFSIGPLNKDLDSPYQLTNFGETIPWVTLGKRKSDYWGSSGTSSETYYKKTTSKDYDGSFAYRLSIIDPPYELSNFLNYHFNYYLNVANGNKEKFLQHIKYVILPLVVKKRGKEVYVNLIEEWLENNGAYKKIDKIQTMNIINTGDINAPTQFQQESANSTQNQNVGFTIEQIEELFEQLKKDIEILKSEQAEDLKIEMQYAVMQLKNRRNAKNQLTNIGKLIKDIGINVFANLAASPLYEVIRPYLGL